MYSEDALKDKKIDSVSEGDIINKAETEKLSIARQKKLPISLRNDDNPMDIIGFM